MESASSPLLLFGRLENLPSQEWFDDIMLVSYPSFQSTLDLMADEGYKAVAFHRTAALEDSRLFATVQKSVP
jgi:uncharacterized protein (DUF1330 family)